ncbi:MAG: tRNA (guanosine(37)-N1)-methyltransferase TrmD [Patescibacteria group bacterium]|nr:tRNA (guanosine(37)-N1)-methyltransferase TrmD [Patescibacteria group bacterium]MCL5262121.1 tRNA (guanosine(37)-N1)-methyltransferase TrmD [Patescibacteria group bacterium]
MHFDVLTIFPEAFGSYLGESILKRAVQKKIIRIKLWDLRFFSRDRHKKVDDRPYGGGPGMVLAIDPINRGVKRILAGSRSRKKSRVILFSPSGRKLDEAMVKRLSRYERLVLICGRYEGVDERVAERVADEEISIGDYVLSGGELPAMVLIEAVARFVPGVLGKYESLEAVKGSYPVYTRPEAFVPGKKQKVWKVPQVLLQGDHRAIADWRRKAAEAKLAKNRGKVD